MKNTGKQFEELFKESCLIQGISCTRLKDAGSYVNGVNTGTGKKYTTTNPCDFICYSGKPKSDEYYCDPKIYFLELKTGKERITFKRLKQTDRLMKKFEENERLHECGYILEIDKKGDKTYYYIEVVDISSFQEIIGKKSFNILDLELAEKLNMARKIETFVPSGKRKERLYLTWL
jgi:hypothetical protein